MNRYIKIEGHDYWLLVYNHEIDTLEDNFSENMQEKLIKQHCNDYINDVPDLKKDLYYRMNMVCNMKLRYDESSKKYGTLLIRPIGSYMILRDQKIVDEKYDTCFPIDEYADIVICENDQKAEQFWIDYLKTRFPNTKILTINFFGNKSEEEISRLFKKAKYVTFSTTFTNLEWYEKLKNNIHSNNTVIGYSHDSNRWQDALKIYSNVEIVNI